MCFFTAGPPIIDSPPVDPFVINSNTAVFECAVLAFPMHSVQWSFTNSFGDTAVIIDTDGVNDTKYEVGTGLFSFGQLTIRDVQYEDRGVYTCTAINVIGSDSASANVTPYLVNARSAATVRCVELHGLATFGPKLSGNYRSCDEPGPGLGLD